MKLAFKFDDGRVIAKEVFERNFTIGRSENCLLCIPSDHFSREHCLVELINGDVYLTDTDSKNGVFINHIRIPKRMKVKHDPKLPLYIGECFVTIDITKDRLDPNHLSLETNSNIDIGAFYKPLALAKKIPARPRAEKMASPKKESDWKGLFLILLIVSAIIGIHKYRTKVSARAVKAERTP